MTRHNKQAGREKKEEVGSKVIKCVEYTICQALKICDANKTDTHYYPENSTT